MNSLMVVRYDGSGFCGWQRLGERDRLKSVQGVLESVLSEVIGESIEVIGSGRTDTGVHAFGQVANFHTVREVEGEELIGVVNQKLPESIQIVEMKRVADSFHSRYDAVAKVYEYHIDLRNKQDVFRRKYRLGQMPQLDIEKMREGAVHLIGKHDFKAFSSAMKDGRETVKTVYSIEFKVENNCLSLSFKGDGFLYNMVRIMVGTLLEVGEGKRSPEDIEKILLSGDRQKAGATAPSQGLFLKEVIYKNI